MLSCVVSTNLELVRRYRTETVFCAFLSAAVARGITVVHHTHTTLVVFGLCERVGTWDAVVTTATSTTGFVIASVAVAQGAHWVFVLGIFLIGM